MYAIYYKPINLLLPSAIFISFTMNLFFQNSSYHIGIFKVLNVSRYWPISPKVNTYTILPKTREHPRSGIGKNVRSGGCEQCHEMLWSTLDMTLVIMTRSQWILMIGHLYVPSWIEDVPTRIHLFLWIY